MSDYLSDEEQAARLRSWWATNGISVLIAAVVAGVGYFGYQHMTSAAQQKAEASTAAFIAYREAEGDKQEAL
ncbi:MAG: tetratricopeptide repeat protein, partial [Pseudomonadota bacterium]|nr:tetratricopeptide repeat protein [Pseudomonadota bacterium]